MAKRSPFALGWRPIGASKPRWQLPDCADAGEPAGLAAGLASFDAGDRLRVYDMVIAPAEGRSVKLVRRCVVP